MDSSSKTNQIKWLTVAVAVLAVLLLSHIALDVLRSSKQNPYVEAAPGSISSDPWQFLTLEEKVRQSSAIVFATVIVENGTATATATDVIVRTTGTEVYYRTGQEVPFMSSNFSSSTDWEGGAVALLVGSPATMKESYSIRDGFIPGLGDMPVEELKRMTMSP